MPASTARDNASTTSGATGGGGATAASGESAADRELIACVVENRAREVAISCMSPLRSHVMQTYLIHDGQSFTETLELLFSLQPKHILLHDGSRKRPLAMKVQMLHGHALAPPMSLVPIFVNRTYFDQDNGAELLRKLSFDSIDSDHLERYTFLASSYCLLKYLENTANVRFPPNSLKIDFSYGYGGRLVIDSKTARDLELVSNARTGSQKESLFGIINRTKTDVGSKALKANLLQPLTEITTIETRLDLVQRIISSDAKILDCIQKVLGIMCDLDRMLSGINTIPTKDDLNTAKRLIDTIILLKTFLELLPDLVGELERLLPGYDEEDEAMGDEGGGQQHNDTLLLEAIIDSLSPPAFAEITSLIQEFICDSAVHEKSTKTRRLQECFAIKAGVCGLLDVARKAFLQSVEDVYELAEQYSKTYGFEDLRVMYSVNRGYYLSLPTTITSLPPLFIQASIFKKSLQCSTEEISSLSRAADESANQCILLTCATLKETLLGQVREHIESLFKAVEAIALLDMHCSFAEYVLSDDTVLSRPSIQTDGPLAIKEGRHPIVSTLIPQYVANSSYASPFANFLVVTGFNGSGKTTLVKQIACIVILAQIGCFVPAAEAIIPVRDRLLSSLGTGDEMESNLSTFMSEMRRANYVLEHCTSKSLIIIDELGRGTSNHDGSSLSYAIAEALLARHAHTFFVTHYRQLIALSKQYGNVRQVHLAADVNHSSNRKIQFRYKLCDGPNDISTGYGVTMAAMVGFPERVLQQAEGIKRFLEENEEYQRGLRRQEKAAAAQGEDEEEEETGVVDGWKYGVLQRLAMIVKETSWSSDQIKDYLHRIRGQIDTSSHTTTRGGSATGGTGDDGQEETKGGGEEMEQD